MFENVLELLEKEQQRKKQSLGEMITAYEKAYRYANLKQYKEAYMLLNECVEPHTPEDQYNWGIAYYNGAGVEKDYKKAGKWFEEAARSEHKGALSVLGAMYFMGLGYELNKKIGIDFFKRAAEQNDADALANLGVAYFNGDEVNKDPEKAIYYFEKAAELNSKTAIYNLAKIYFFGINIEKSIWSCWHYISKLSAKDFDNEESGVVHYIAGMLYLNPLLENHKSAIKHLKSAANKGDKEAQYIVGLMTYKGLGVEKNVKDGLSWIKKLSDNGYDKAKDLFEEKGDLDSAVDEAYEEVMKECKNE